jgi:Trypsin-co-occurring domain 1
LSWSRIRGGDCAATNDVGECAGKAAAVVEYGGGLFRDLSPDQAVTEFMLKVGGETRIVIAKGTAEVYCKVTTS